VNGAAISTADRFTKDRAIENEGMELAVFPAWINSGRQIVEQGLIEKPPCELCVELASVDADHHRLEPGVNEVPGEL